MKFLVFFVRLLLPLFYFLTLLVFACVKAFLRAGLTQPLEHAKGLLLAMSRG